MRVDDLMLRHAELKAQIAARDLAKKRRKAEFEAELKEALEGEYGSKLDDELETVRNDLKSIARGQENQTYEGPVGKLLLEERQLSWEIFDPLSFAKWVVANERVADLLDFQKNNVNRLCDGLSLAKFNLPFGVQPKMSEVLEVKVARPQAVE